jgi:hypothetical protein
VGGLFNIKSAPKKIKEVQKIAVEKESFKIPLIFCFMDVIHGYGNYYSVGTFHYLGYRFNWALLRCSLKRRRRWCAWTFFLQW